MRGEHVRVQVRMEVGRLNVEPVSGAGQYRQHRVNAQQSLARRHLLVREQTPEDGDEVRVVFQVDHVGEPAVLKLYKVRQKHVFKCVFDM